jgi:branched-chain amino acid transport system permease protein
LELIYQQVMNASMLGIIYSLIALGFTLYFGVSGVANFSHGDFCMVGPFAILSLGLITMSLTFFTPGGFLFPILIVAGIAVTGLVGILMERITVRPFRFSSKATVLLATIAFGIVVREFVMVAYPKGANPHAFPKLFPQGGISLGTMVLPFDNFLIIVIGVLLIVGVSLLIYRTRIGISMRAVEQNMDAARMMGVDIDRTIAFTFFLGSSLGAAAGILTGEYYGIVRFDMGVMAGLKGFSAAVVGGLGNVYGSIVGGILLGFLESFIAAFVPGGSAYKDIVAFLFLVLFLIFRPMGILGKKEG